MNIQEYNSEAWDKQVQQNNEWTQAVSSEEIAKARKGEWKIVLTPSKDIPKSWYPSLEACKILCLASGGGQQGPILAALGAEVTVFDNSAKQLAQDEMVAKREDLNIKTVKGDMVDLSMFAAESFDLILHPCSNCFVPNILPVWKEAYRVLKKGGILMAGFINPLFFIFDWKLLEKGILEVKHKIPYSDVKALNEEELAEIKKEGTPLEFGHSLQDQIGGQTAAGFQITDLFEDDWGTESKSVLDKYIKTFIATRAIK